MPHIQTFELHRSEGNRMLNFGVDKYDQRLGEVHGDEFICLLSYNVKIYEDAKYQDKNSASINQLDSFFPAYFLEIAPELKDDSLKGDIFKEIVRDDTPTGYYTIDSDKVNKINT
ncbi:MAG: hypothetical protein MJ233_02875 [Mycoplasmoidaceae bacterium]|nr:hypothetical protein [Mycoplasmoidaceae bacterium]